MAQMKKPMRPSRFVQRTPSTGTGIKKPMPKPKYPGLPLGPGETPDSPRRVQRSKTAASKPTVRLPNAKPLPAKPKPKPRIVQMPTKISPSKMTPAQKAKYLQNPERYDK